MLPFLGFTVSLVVRTKLVHRVYTAHVIDIIVNSFWTRLWSERTITLLSPDLDNIWAVIVWSDPKRLSVSPYEDFLSTCSGLTTKLGCKFVRPQVRLILLHDGLVNPTWKNRSNGVDTVLAELFQEGNSRKEPVKGHYKTLICQGLIKINDNSLHRLVIKRSSLLLNKPSSLVDLKAISIPFFTVAARKAPFNFSNLATPNFKSSAILSPSLPSLCVNPSASLRTTLRPRSFHCRKELVTVTIIILFCVSWSHLFSL